MPPPTLLGQKGIWTPRQLDLPISISTAPPRPRRRLVLPARVADRPAQEFVEERYEVFRRAG
jgi:hypothetical protein